MNDEWFVRMESNLSVIFGEMKSGRKKEKIHINIFENKLLEQGTLLHNGQEFLLNMIQKENFETRRIFGSDLTWVSQEMEKWFGSLRDENDQVNHHVIMLKEFHESKTMISDNSIEIRQLREENANNIQAVYAAINGNSEKINEVIDRIELAKLSLPEFLQEQSEMDMKRFVVNNNQLKANYDSLNKLKEGLIELRSDLQNNIRESVDLHKKSIIDVLRAIEDLRLRREETPGKLGDFKNEVVSK
jgi:hypothetical protein